MRTPGILAAIALTTAALAGSARAESRAWTAARAALPGDTKVVVGIDVAAIQKSQMFAKLFPKLRERADVAKVLDTIKDSCKVDPVGVIQGLVVATADDTGDGAVYLAMVGIDRARLSSCLAAASQADHKDAKVTVKQSGNLTEVTEGSDTAFLGWVGKDVVVVSFHSQDKASLARWMGGKGALARSGLGKTLGKVNTAAAVWGAAEGIKELQPGMTAKGGYGAVTYARGSVSTEIHAVMESAAQAGTAATTATQQLSAVKDAGQFPPELGAVMKAITISADKDEVRIRATITEGELMAAVSSAMAAFGGM
jgi:hypothetical protein